MFKGAPGRDAALRSLRDFSKTTIAELEESLGETVTQETDRGVVILLSTAVEDMLLRRIQEAMVPLNSDETNRLFGPEGAIGTFAHKIRVAHAFGYIDRETATMCHVVREMRNACAHSGRAISFANKELSDALAVAYRFISDEVLEGDQYERVPEFGKLQFVWLVGYLLRVIRTGSKDEAAQLVNRLIADVREAVLHALAQQNTSRKTRRTGSSSTRLPSRPKD